jgi:drug/metabolite transporter (DMT)-like permease
MAALMAIGVDQGSATIGSIVIGLEPIGVALAALAFAGARLSRPALAALIIGFAGAVVASGVLTEPAGKSPIEPMILLFGTVVAFSIYTAMVRRVGVGVDPLAVAAVTQVGALFLVIPACILDITGKGMIRSSGVHPKALGAVLFLGFGSALAYLLLCKVISNQPPSRVAVSMFLTPMFGVMFSWLIVGEHLHLRDALGGALVVGSLWISERTARPQPMIALPD